MARPATDETLSKLVKRIAALGDIKTLKTDQELDYQRTLLSSIAYPPRLLAAAETLGIANWFAARFKQRSTWDAGSSAGWLWGVSSLFCDKIGQDNFECQYPEWLVANRHLDWFHKDRLCPVVTYLQLLIRETPSEDWADDRAMRLARTWATEEAGEQTVFVAMAVTMGRRAWSKEQLKTLNSARTEPASPGFIYTLTHWVYSGFKSEHAPGYVPILESHHPERDHAVQRAKAELQKLGEWYAWLLSREEELERMAAEPALRLEQERLALSEFQARGPETQLLVDTIPKALNQIALRILWFKDFILAKLDISAQDMGLRAVPDGQISGA